MSRRSLRLPIMLAIVMFVLLIVLTVGWAWVTIAGALAHSAFAGIYWTAFGIGTAFLVLVLIGVVVYLILSIKTINLTQRQSNFIDSVTHELKSPIASLKLYLQTLNLRMVSDDERDGFYRFMLDDVDRLDHLINHVLEAGRLDREAVDEQVEDVRLDDVLRECAQSVCLNYRLPADTVRLTTSPFIVSAQQVDLDIIFRNLIDNAVKYASVEPEVDVILQASPGGGATIRICDNGSGIPPKLRRKIFGRFVRLGLELERQKPGTGLGLYIVRTLVRRLRGRVRVYGRDDRPGTVFEVYLPGQAVLIESEPAETAEAEVK